MDGRKMEGRRNVVDSIAPICFETNGRESWRFEIGPNMRHPQVRVGEEKRDGQQREGSLLYSALFAPGGSIRLRGQLILLWQRCALAN